MSNFRSPVAVERERGRARGQRAEDKYEMPGRLSMYTRKHEMVMGRERGRKGRRVRRGDAKIEGQ